MAIGPQSSTHNQSGTGTMAEYEDINIDPLYEKV